MVQEVCLVGEKKVSLRRFYLVSQDHLEHFDCRSLVMEIGSLCRSGESRLTDVKTSIAVP